MRFEDGLAEIIREKMEEVQAVGDAKAVTTSERCNASTRTICDAFGRPAYDSSRYPVVMPPGILPGAHARSTNANGRRSRGGPLSARRLVPSPHHSRDANDAPIVVCLLKDPLSDS